MPERIPYSADQIVEATLEALQKRDMQAVGDLLGLLALVDARRARQVYDVIELALNIGSANPVVASALADLLEFAAERVSGAEKPNGLDTWEF